MHAPTSLSKTEDIKSWDTEKYLKTLSKFNNDNIFNDQISKITEKQYDFDKTATNENYYNLNLYDIYFQPCSNIIEENITRILQFQYSNSPTFRRLVNYHTDNLPNYDINKCQIYITNTFAYNKKEDSVSELFIALDEKGNFIVPKTESLEEISPEKILLNFFLKHISNPDILGYDDIDTYTNIIFKELSPQAIAHTSKSFQHASVRDKYKLYDCENSTKQIDNIEQVISKGSTLQKEFFDSYIKNKELDPIPSQKKGIQFKKIALNGLLLTSGLFQTLNNNQHSGNSNSLDKINVRHSRSLPEEHSAPAETKSSSIVKGINEFILKKAASLYNLLTNLELELQLENYIRGYHELLAFSQTGIWTRNGRDAARNYIVEIMKQHFYKFEIEYNSGRVVFFQDFIEKHREYEYNIYETFARDIIVHPLPFDLDYAPPEKGGIIRSEPANHYMQTVRQKFSHSAPLHFDNLYGKESIFLSVALHDLKSNKKLSKRDFEHLFKIAQLVIHHLSKDGGDKILCSSYGVKYHRLILNEIVTRCKHHQRHINESIIEKISLAIITNNDLSNQIKSKILKLNSQKNYCNPWLMILATEKQLSWAEAHYKAQKHIESHIQDCELLGLMDTNKMVRDAITGFIHQINEITESSWMSSEEQHAKKILALEMFKTKISTLNGGQGFVYGFNKVIQEGLGGLIELSFDIDDEWHHRALSSLSPASRNGLHLLGTIWNIVMSAVPGFNALAGTSSILNHAVVEKSTDVCSYIQDAIRIGMEAVPVAESKFTKKSSNSKYIGLRFVEEKINKNLINEPLQRGSSYRVIESIENTDFIYQKITKKILELMTTENNELYSATGFNNENYGYYKRSGDGFYRKQHSFQPLSKETPNKITYNNRELELIKESNSEIYCGTFTDNGKNSIVKFYKSSDGSFYQAEGLKGGGLIRHTDKPYSELKEGDIGYDEELLDITDDSPELEETLPAISEDLYPSEEENVQNIYSKFKSGDIEAGMTEVTLCRGTIASQAENIVSYSTAGGAEIANPNVNPVSEDIAKLQIKSGRIEPEYTTDISVADRFSRGHHLVIVKVRVKYLTRGSISESGWIIPQNAPIEPVGLIDRTYGQPENIQQANAS